MTSSKQIDTLPAHQDDAPDTGSAHHNMANAIRALSMDAVQAARSGHPGLPMGTADIATVLFTKFMKMDPRQPHWPDRDRFILSAGHGSMLLYSLLYLLGYEGITLEDVKAFRQLGSKTAGHPEAGHIPGIETTTGPLGQGLSNAVGFAMAERIMAAQFGDDLVNHHTYVLASDGDLMEGISHEAISLAGHLKLSRLIVLFDDNGISIDGPVDLAESGDMVARFQAAGWDAERIDGHDPSAIEAAIKQARDTDKPSMIACKTTIGYGAPNKAGTAGAHGAPLGEEEIALARKELDWPHKAFHVPCEVLDAWRVAALKAAKPRKAWEERLAARDPEIRAEFNRRLAGTLPKGLEEGINTFKNHLCKERPTWATRKSSQEVLGVINPLLPETIGGSADLTGSNNTRSPGLETITPDDFSGRYIHYGIREHAMAAAMNGMALHGGLLPYAGTFLVFTDYCRPSIRMSALMKQRVIYVMTHDSIGLGEDGPTHQPIEHLASLRAMPNLNVFRPADAVETAECWQLALEAQETPSILALTRQNLPAVRTEPTGDNLCARGAYELLPAKKEAQVTLIATGSEVAIAVEARTALQKEGMDARVVSAPCLDLFERQSPEYKAQILGPDTHRIAIEAASGFGWEKYTGTRGRFIGMDTFGASGPYQELYTHFNITVEAITEAAKQQIARAAPPEGRKTKK